MPCRRIASNWLWTPDTGFIPRPLAEFDDAGRLLRVERCDAPDRLAATEHFAGLLVPRFVDASPLVGPDGLQRAFPEAWCLRADDGPVADEELRRLRAGGRTLLCVGAGSGAGAPLVSVLAALLRAQEATGAPLDELLVWATRNGAWALERLRGAAAGRGEEIGSGPFCLLAGLDYVRMRLTPRTTVRPLL